MRTRELSTHANKFRDRLQRAARKEWSEKEARNVLRKRRRGKNSAPVGAL